MQGKVEICGVNTSKLKVLRMRRPWSAGAAPRGDMEAREQLIAGNLRLVLSVIQKFSNRERIWTTCSRLGALVL